MTAARSKLEPVVLRELPQHTRPLTNELLSSFLDRLGAHNGLSRKTLNYLIDTSGLTQVQAVSQLTGLQATTLTATLPELRVTVPRKVSAHSRHHYLGFDGTNTACGGCVAQRTGERAQARVWSSHHEAVCLRHRRWIGSPSMPSLGQLDLSAAPDIIQAGRHHRQIVQRHRCKAAGAAFIWAVTLVDDWQRRGALPDVRDRARLLFRVEPDVMLSTAPQVQAAHYPLSVRLTRLIMTPGWLKGATSGPAGWNHAASQIADQITSGYRPSTANHDAFARLLRDTESRTCEPRTATS
jgi:hypothetical protein